MQYSQFLKEFQRLCDGFRYVATSEQAQAWYQRIGQRIAIEPWTESVTTLLCGSRFPHDLNQVLGVVETQAQAARAKAIMRDARQATVIVDRLGTQQTDFDPKLFAAIKAFAGRDQVRRNRQLLNRKPDADPGMIEREQKRLTGTIHELLERLDPVDIHRLLDRYEAGQNAA